MKLEKKQTVVFRNGWKGKVMSKKRISVGIVRVLDIDDFYDENLETMVRHHKTFDIDLVYDENGDLIWERGENTRWVIEKSDASKMLEIVKKKFDLSKTKDYLEYQEFVEAFKRY